VGKPLVRFREGPGRNLDHGRDHVAPPGNQAANREHKRRPTVRGVPGLLKTPSLLTPSLFRDPEPLPRSPGPLLSVRGRSENKSVPFSPWRK
jgi:hypothetical protein